MDDIDQIQKRIDKVRVELVNGIQIQGFFDKMRSEGVLSLEDCQEMIVPSLYPTDRAKASHFLDVISTRGQRGYDVFVECLDEQYPRLFTILTGNEPSPRSPTAYHHNSVAINFTPGFGQMLEEISAQNIKLQHENNENKYTIEKLTEEREYMASMQTMFEEKMENYQKVIRRTKHLEYELCNLKDELLNLFIRLGQTEKERDRFKELLRKKKVIIDDYKDKLEISSKLLDSKVMFMHKATGKNTQLSQENNNLQKEIQQIKMEMEAAKRQSHIFLGGSFGESVELDKDAVIEILRQDKDAVQRECDEVSQDLHRAKQKLVEHENQIDKLEEENKDLRCVVEVNQKEIIAYDRINNVLSRDLQLCNRNYKMVADQRRQLHAQLDELKQENDQRQILLQEEFYKYRTNLRSGVGNFHANRDSFMSESSGISSMNGTFYDDMEANEKGKAETLPRAAGKIKPNRPSQRAVDIMSNRESIRPMHRPRARQIRRGDSGLTLNDDTFPIDEIPPTKMADTEENNDDGDEVTFEKITRHFADRPMTFSESLQGHHGSWKKKDRSHYENVDLELNKMRQSIIRPKKKVGLHNINSLAVDLDDESDELAKILGETNPENPSQGEVPGTNGHADRSNDDMKDNEDLPPLPAKTRPVPAERPRISTPSKPAKVARPSSPTRDDPRQKAVQNDDADGSASPLTRKRLGARRSNCDESVAEAVRGGYNGLDEE